MIIKRFFFCILLLVLGNCGYEPMYSKKTNLSETIQSFKLEGDKIINRKIISFLNLKNQNKTTGYKLIINSNKSLGAIQKDSAGNASIYKTTITVKISILDNDEVFKEKTFNAEFTYNNIENKFNLSQYQKDIEENLINKILEEIFVYLTFNK